MSSIRVNMQGRDEYGNTVRVTRLEEWKPIPASITIPAVVVLLALLLKLMQYSLTLLVL